ncbi:IPT domain containing protein [Candidatus Methylacidiphilaceae bacterium]
MKNILRNSNFGFTKWCVALIVAGCMGVAQAQAQVTITPGATVTQNFSSLGVNATATLPSGWKASKSANVREVTAYSTAVTAVERAGGAGLSSSAANGIYNFGSSETDRAVGGLSSGSASKSVNLYVAIQNTGGSSIPSFSISYKAERYRNGSNTAGFSIQMYYSTDGTTWTSAGSSFLSGFAANADNNGAATVPIETKNVTSQALANSLAAGSTLYLAWNYSVTSGTTTSNAQALGVSDIEIVAAGGGGGTPPTITGISPSSGLAGTIVTITGTDFTGATAVSFNGVAAASYTVDSATSITATVPSGATTGPISVTTAGGSAVSANNFTVPKLTIAAPSSLDEGNSAQLATITADPAPTSDLTITLSSSSGADLQVDGGFGFGATATATIFSGTTSATFFLNAPADNTVDADAPIGLTASATGYNSGTATATVKNVDFNPPTVVINKFENTAVDVIELLVVGNGTSGATVDLRGMLIKDHSSSNVNDTGGKYVFTSDTLWQAVPAGTLIVLKLDATATDVNIDGFVVTVGLNNTTYFTKGTGTMDLAGTELVMLKESGSPEAGSVGMIHALANGSATAVQTAAAGSPKLVDNVGTAGVIYASNPNSTIADYNGSSVALGAAGTIPFGSANNPANAAFIAGLKGTKDISISIAADTVIVNEDAGVQADKITVALSVATTSDLTVNLSATPAGIVNLPVSVTIPAGSSSATVGFTPLNDNTIAGNRTVTIAGSADTWSSANSTVTVVDVQFANPSVVINEVVNSAADSIELLVIQNNLSMVGMILKDFSGNMGGDSGGSYTFNDVALWQSVKAGTLVVLTNDATATEDTDASDGLITVKLANTTYFTAAGSFDISNTDLVMIKSAGSGASGITGAIHTFGNGPAGTLFKLANGTKLLFTTGGAGGGADNATSAVSDYSGTGATAGNTLGTHNNSQNQAYIVALRASVNSAPTDIGLTATSIAENSVVDGVLGTLSSTDADSGDTFTYSLVSGTGDTDNASFNISGASLRTSVAFDFEVKSSYSVRVRTTDSGGATFEKTFTITVTDVVEGSTYSSWLGALTPSDAAFLDYVFGAATPGTLDPTLKPTVMVTGGNLVLTYYVRQGTVGLTVTPKTSDDLAAGPSGWVTTDVTVADVGTPRPVNGVNVQQKTASVPVSGAKKFLRVEAVQQ